MSHFDGLKRAPFLSSLFERGSLIGEQKQFFAIEVQFLK